MPKKWCLMVSGGKRQGAGLRKCKKLSGGKLTPLYLDDVTRAIFSALGNGNMSEGARLAGEIASQHRVQSDKGGTGSAPDVLPSK